MVEECDPRITILKEDTAILASGARRYLDEMANDLNSRNISAKSEVGVGNSAAEIVDYADKEEIDLILMATHGSSGIKRWLLSSVAAKIVRDTERPVVLIRAKDGLPAVSRKGALSKIFVPLDGSSESEASLPYVEHLAFKLNIETVLIQVVEQIYYVYGDTHGGASIPYSPEEMKPITIAAAEYLQKVNERLRNQGINSAFEIRTGHVAEQIIEFADEIGADLVAMSTHGRSGIRRWALGSVAEKVVHERNNPLLLVRAPGTIIE
ncbi:MAG: universal stress protein [Proteobacteria bacterium]|nr:universal stress protein [Pseudomonadota bacterium]